MTVDVRVSDGDRFVIELPDIVFPVQLGLPDGFVPEQPSTWPRLDGRLEYVGGRLFYMPPSGELQSETASDVNYVLANWARSHPGFAVRANEPGMKLGEDVRGTDAGVWARSDAPARHEFARTPPILAVEVTGRDDTLDSLRGKAQWYLERGVGTVWILDADACEVLVCTGAAESRHAPGSRLPPVAGLPGLEAMVDDLFRQASLRRGSAGP